MLIIKIQFQIVMVKSNQKSAQLKLSWMVQRMQGEVAQVLPISFETIAAVKVRAVGMDAKRKRHLKTVLLESQIANGWSIQHGSMVTNCCIKLSETSNSKVCTLVMQRVTNTQPRLQIPWGPYISVRCYNMNSVNVNTWRTQLLR